MKPDGLEDIVLLSLLEKVLVSLAVASGTLQTSWRPAYLAA